MELALNTEFKDYLKYEDLYQSSKNRHVYKNQTYMISFPHDFNSKKPLREQLEKVQEKYDRRISRFYESASEPTLFFRYCENAEEIKALNNDYEAIVGILKSYNSENELIVIIQDEAADEDLNKMNNVNYVERDPGSDRAALPLSKNKELFEMLSCAPFESKEKNLEFLRIKNEKKEKNKNSLRYKVNKKMDKIRKGYIHDKEF